MTTRLLLPIASAFFALVPSASAHPNYDRPAGTFQRGDGMVINIVEHYSDGIVAADPVSVQFRLPDGTVLARTEFTPDIAIRRPSSDSVDVYQFEGTFIPVASRIYRFDGYTLADITSASTRSVSPLVHTARHWLGYIIALALAAFFVAFWFAARTIPRRGWLLAVRFLGFTFAFFAAAFYLLMLLWMAPLSIPVLFFLGFICYLLYAILCRVLTRTKVA